MRYVILFIIIYSTNSFSCNSIFNKWKSCRTIVSEMTVYEKFLARAVNKKHRLTITKSGNFIIFQGKIRKILRFDSIYSDTYNLNSTDLYLNPVVNGRKMPNVEVELQCNKKSLIQRIHWVDLNIYNYHQNTVKAHSDHYEIVYKKNGRDLIKNIFKIIGPNKKLVGKIKCRL